MTEDLIGHSTRERVESYYCPLLDGTERATYIGCEPPGSGTKPALGNGQPNSVEWAMVDSNYRLTGYEPDELTAALIAPGR